MTFTTMMATLTVTGLLLTTITPALAQSIRPDLSVGTTDRRENMGIHQFSFPTDSPVALPTRSSAKALETQGGVVFIAGVGAPIYAVADGVVVSSGPAGVVLYHGNGLRSTVTNVSHIRVMTGQKVRGHDILGKVASPKVAERSHFFFKVNEGARVVDPMDFLPAVDPNAE